MHGGAPNPVCLIIVAEVGPLPYKDHGSALHFLLRGGLVPRSRFILPIKLDAVVLSLDTAEHALQLVALDSWAESAVLGTAKVGDYSFSPGE